MAHPSWYLEIVKVSTHQQQQDLLNLLREVAGVTALGTMRDDEHFVVYDCPERQLKLAIERLVLDIDPGAERSYTLDETSSLSDEPA